MKRNFFWVLAVIGGLVSLWQTPSLQAQLFQNNDTSCEDKVVVGVNTTADSQTVDAVSNSITCGQFNDDTASGNSDFPDCATQVDPAPQASPAPQDTNSVLINTGAHGQNCVNAGEPNNQFEDAFNLSNQSIPLVSPFPIFGTIQAGNLDNGGFDDLAWAFVSQGSLAINTGADDRAAQYLFSNAGGSFNPGPFNPGASLLGEHPAVSTGDLLMPSDFFRGTLSAERSLILFDCDNDGVDEAATGAFILPLMIGPQPQLGFGLSQNMGAGLLDALTNSPPDFFAFPIQFVGEGGIVALTFADFDGDGPLDVMAAVKGFGGLSGVVFCQGDGSCGFDCPTTVPDPNVFNLSAACQSDIPGCTSPDPTSITRGDYDHNGLLDVAVAESGFLGMSDPSPDVIYLLNNGGDLATWDRVRVPFNGATLQTAPLVVATGKFSNEAFANDTDEVAATLRNDLDMPIQPSQVAVMTTDGIGGINAPLHLEFALPDTLNSTSLAVEDFDHCGGDDIIALGSTDPDTVGVVRRASLFLNSNEAPEVIIDPNFSPSLILNVPSTILATCTDPTMDQRDFQWSVLSQPAGSNVVFGNGSGTLLSGETDASSSVTVDTQGDYVFQLNCVDFCGLADSATVGASAVLLTQGANLFHCSLNPEFDGKGNPMIWMLILMIPAVLLLYRLSRKRWFIPTLLALLILGASSGAHALTPSVSVNTFQPTVDDSEYFTVYNSPTMLRRNFHVGFYLDYAHHPYEFGTQDFDRVSGIVDHLLDANIVGSYAVLNWMTVGLVIPVHLFEGLDSPILGLDESNFALGDVVLVLKFRLLDRKKHHVGIAVVPFASFPTSTNSPDFLGNGRVNGGAKLVIDGRIKDRVSIALNVGANFRNRFIDVSGQDIDDQFLASLGVSVDIIKNMFKWIGEVQTITVFKNFYSDRRTTPAEARLGFRYTWANNHDINFGAGMGFSNGIGQPDVRAFVGYTYTKRPIAEVEIPPPPVSEVTVQVGDELTLKDKIYFEFDSDKIRDISKPTLDKIAAFLKAHPEITKIRIDGYTCDLGTARYNLGLSDRRAQSAARYLEGQGIDPSRIGTVKGYGEADPLVPNVDEAHREQNRRVQIFVEAVDPSLATGATTPATADE